MATSSRTKPGRILLVFLAVLAGLYALVALSGTWTPRLGLDLKGGTSITLKAETISGEGEITGQKLDEAVEIIRDRVNGTGVSESQVTAQSDDQVVVEIPGEQKPELAETIGETAQLRFRMVYGSPVPAPPKALQQQSANQPSSGGGGQDGQQEQQPEQPGQQRGAGNNRVATGWGAPPEQPDLEGAELVKWRPTPALQRKFEAFTCPKKVTGQNITDVPAKPLITCDENYQKYLLSPTIIEGTDLTDATMEVPGAQSPQYAVNLEFDDDAGDVFGDVTTAINGTGRQFAIVLDGRVLSAPTVSSGPILNGQAQITGNFNEESASNLANSLKYGALPLSFSVQTSVAQGPELASDHLRGGVIAGIVGLILIVLYCLLYYRALGFVVVASLGIAGAATYAIVLLLGETLGFTLTLPGIAGLIVAIGITADSFIVYFERLRDEVREGRTLRVAVEYGWERAKRTVLAADGVTFLAALVLYIFAIGEVKGFAFALGLTTLVDVFIVFFFTKPLVTLLARRKLFARGHKLSGFDPEHLGVRRKQSVTGKPRAAGEVG